MTNRWRKCYDSRTRTHFYYNFETGETTWFRPLEFEEDTLSQRPKRMTAGSSPSGNSLHDPRSIEGTDAESWDFFAGEEGAAAMADLRFDDSEDLGFLPNSPFIADLAAPTDTTPGYDLWHIFQQELASTDPPRYSDYQLTRPSSFPLPSLLAPQYNSELMPPPPPPLPLSSPSSGPLLPPTINTFNLLLHVPELPDSSPLWRLLSASSSASASSSGGQRTTAASLHGDLVLRFSIWSRNVCVSNEFTVRLPRPAAGVAETQARTQASQRTTLFIDIPISLAAQQGGQTPACDLVVFVENGLGW